MPTSVKVLTKDEVRWLNDYAIKRHANMTLEPVMVERLDNNLRYPIIMSVLHDRDDTVRCLIALGEERKDSAWLDIDMGVFNRLAETEVELGEAETEGEEGGTDGSVEG